MTNLAVSKNLYNFALELRRDLSVRFVLCEVPAREVPLI